GRGGAITRNAISLPSLPVMVKVRARLDMTGAGNGPSPRRRAPRAAPPPPLPPPRWPGRHPIQSRFRFPPSRALAPALNKAGSNVRILVTALLLALALRGIEWSERIGKGVGNGHRAEARTPSCSSGRSTPEESLFFAVARRISSSDEHVPTHPAQRFRHGVRRPHSPRNVDTPARPFIRLYLARPLGEFGAHARAGPVRWSLSCRCARCLRCLRRKCGRLVARRRSDPATRSDGAGAGNGLCDDASRLWSHMQPRLRAAFPVRSAHGDTGSSDTRPDRLEHRHRLPR